MESEPVSAAMPAPPPVSAKHMLWHKHKTIGPQKKRIFLLCFGPCERGPLEHQNDVMHRHTIGLKFCEVWSDVKVFKIAQETQFSSWAKDCSNGQIGEESLHWLHDFPPKLDQHCKSLATHFEDSGLSSDPEEIL